VGVHFKLGRPVDFRFKLTGSISEGVPGNELQIRKVEIRELPPPAAGPKP
jgi:hypothetical protein